MQNISLVLQDHWSQTCRMNLRDSLLATLVAIIWGSNFVVIEWGMHGVPPLLFAALRFIAVIVPAAFFVRRPQVPWRVIVGVGVFMSLGQFAFLYTSMAAGMPAGLAALVLQAQVIFTALIAAVALAERPTRNQGIGIFIGALGLLVVGFGRGGHIPLIALLLCLAGALSWGLGNVIARSAAGASGLSLTVWSALFVPGPLLALSVTIDGPHDVGAALAGLGWQAVLSTTYTAIVSTLVAYSIFNALLGRNPASSVTPFILIVPPVAMVGAWLLLGETPGTAEMVGGAVVLLGVLVTTRRGSASALGVRRAATFQTRQRSSDAAGGEVGAELVDLIEGAEVG